MKLKRTPELYSFLLNYISESDADADQEMVRKFIASSSSAVRDQVIMQSQALLADPEFPTDELGSEANRWFSDDEEARAWLRGILLILKEKQPKETVAVLDSNGTLLNEGDSVQVIKDLKVKGGSSDLKRGTLIKKIHLIDDSENVECRVDGSTLVLKTCFLKKA